MCFLLTEKGNHRRSTGSGAHKSGTCHSTTPWLRDSRPLTLPHQVPAQSAVTGMAFTGTTRHKNEFEVQGAYHLNSSLQGFRRALPSALWALGLMRAAQGQRLATSRWV